MLELEGLDVRVGTRTLVSGVDLAVAAGERVALVGPSGSGKSLTAAAVLGTLGPAYAASGRLLLEGRPVDLRRRLGRTRRERAGLAAVHQASATALNPLVRVGAQLVEAARARRGLTRAAARDLVLDLLGQADLADPAVLIGRHPAELSGGQLQRVCTVLALVCAPRLLVADEPTTALDAVARARVVDLLERHCADSGAALLLVTHDREVAARLCSRTVALAEGRVA